MTTVLSTKGQLIIPLRIREQLKLRPGDDFTIRVDAGAVVLKKIQPDPPKTRLEKKKKGRGLRPT